MKISSVSFCSTYISDNVKGMLSQTQQNALWELGKQYSNRHIIAGLKAGETPDTARSILLRINDIISAKEIGRLFIPTSFIPEQLEKCPRYIFRA